MQMSCQVGVLAALALSAKCCGTDSFYDCSGVIVDGRHSPIEACKSYDFDLSIVKIGHDFAVFTPFEKSSS